MTLHILSKDIKRERTEPTPPPTTPQLHRAPPAQEPPRGATLHEETAPGALLDHTQPICSLEGVN